MEVKEMEQSFLQFIKKMNSYNEALSLMQWDLRTGSPKNSVAGRSEAISLLFGDVFEMSTGEEMANFLEKLMPHSEQLSDVARHTLAYCKKEYDRNKLIPVEEYKEYVMLQTQSESVWAEAKEKSDFTIFQPYLEKIVAFNKKFIGYWGYEGKPYNTLLDLYEPGVTVDVLDEVFGKLKEKLVPLVQKISQAKKLDTSFLYRHFPKEKQRELSVALLKELGYDFDSGRLDETIHPFQITINRGDVRVTTQYNESNFQSCIFGTIHECGHAVYEQNISKEWEGTPMCSGTSMGIHESQSLFYESFIGRTRGFWERNYEVFKQYAPAFQDVSLDDFYKAVNESKPSLIRIEADEVTYALHIMVRYEIEKGLFNGEIEVKDLPTIWNDKYEQYLGIRPKNDAEGVLQDVHWSDGSFGYFPSYALGYMYAAQLKTTLLKDLPNFEELVAAGNIKPIQEWMTKHIHQFGKTKKPLDILRDTTGEGLNVHYFVNYLEEKYKKMYELI